MSDDPRLFMRLPPEAAEALFAAFRDQLEGSAGYTPPPAAPDPLQPVREYLRGLTADQLEAEYRKFCRRMRTPAPRAHDSMRALGVGGQHPQAAAINRSISPFGRF